MTASSRAVTLLRLGAWIFALALVCGVVWAFRFTMSPDGIAYIDLSDSYLHGDWSGAVNGYWSPLFPMVIALVRRIIGSGPAHDFAAARIALLLAYVAGMLGMEALVRAILDRRAQASGEAPEPRERAMWWALGYALFIWASVPLMPEELVTPDRFVNAALFFAAAAAVRIAARRASVATAVWLGAALGIGYLAKAVMFPVSLVMLGALALVLLRARASLRNVVIAAVVFACVAAPQVIAVSRLSGHPSFGEVGRLGFAWFVDRAPCPLWPTDQECMGSPNGVAVATSLPPQPFPALMSSPHVFSFADHARGTLPIWYDASRWYPHLAPTFPVKRMVFVFVTNLGKYWQYLTPFLIALVAAGAAWRMAVRQSWRGVAADLLPLELVLVVPAVVTLVLYALVYTESRYFGAFIALGVLGVAARARAWVPAALLAGALIALVGGVTVSARDAWWRRGEGYEQMAEARALTAMGVVPGSRVAVIGSPYHSYWARLARVQVIGEVYQSEAAQFWCGGPAVQRRVLDAFASLGARAVVTTQLAACANLDGWQKIGATDYAMLLPRAPVSAGSAPR